MKLTIAKSEQEFYAMVAWRIAAQIACKPDAVIGFSTGRTTGGVHAALADLYTRHPFDTTKVTAYPLDEVTGVSPEFPGSCYYMILHEVVLPLGIPMEHFIYLPTTSDDFARECNKFLSELDARGGIDLQVLGLGENGHLGFNQPGTPFGQSAWHSTMMPELEERLRRESGSGPDVRMGGVTLGIREIMQSRKIVMAANGRHKAAMVKAMLQGPVNESIPASILQLHPDCEVILDPAAAAEL
jgi:glucosamine-6-phosphate deaminase